MERARARHWHLRNRRVSLRQIIYQLVFILAVGGVVWAMIRNAITTLGERGVATGFGFLVHDEANFVISETVPLPVPNAGLVTVLAILGLWALAVVAVRRRARGEFRSTLTWVLLAFLPALALYLAGHMIRTVRYEVPSTYALGLLTGVGNTLKVSFGSLVLGTLIGFAIGIARLSSNWMVSRLSSVVVEITRNIPLLLQIFFWYFAVIAALPSVRQSITFGSWLVLNNRGISVARIRVEPDLAPLLLALVIGLSGLLLYRISRRKIRHALPGWWPGIVIVGACLVIGWLAAGARLRLDLPTLEGFNYRGGVTLTPEFSAMLIGLSLYSAGFIAEIVRSAILSVPRGQTEAALSLGLRRRQVLTLVTIPQARRVMIPPLVGTYLGTIKDSSLGVAIGYPELVSVGGTILDVSGQVLEVLGLTIVFYMTMSLLVSAAMNWYNARIQTESA
jgi:general L-amino acid transport system permease protein